MVAGRTPQGISRPPRTTRENRARSWVGSSEVLAEHCKSDKPAEPEEDEAVPDSEADWGTDSNASETGDTEKEYEARGHNRKQELKLFLFAFMCYNTIQRNLQHFSL